MTAEDELTIESAHGLPPEHLGMRLAAGAGLAGKVLEADRPMMTEDYAAVGRPEASSPSPTSRRPSPCPCTGAASSAASSPPPSGTSVRLTQRHLDALEAFAELAAVAFQNASAHATLARAARTDPLTGCLNHAALHEGLARELERAERAPGARALARSSSTSTASRQSTTSTAT